MSSLSQVEMSSSARNRVPGGVLRHEHRGHDDKPYGARSAGGSGATPFTAHAGALLGLGERQVQRLCRVLREHGPSGLVSKKRGQPSNRRLSDALRQRAPALIRERFTDFGPTLAQEKLLELHYLRVSVETLRKWMIEDGLWVPRARRQPRPHQPHRRREGPGELVQIGGCEHAWFEERGSKCTLLVFADDATGRLMQLSFVESESTFSYFGATGAWSCPRQTGQEIRFVEGGETAAVTAS